MTRSNTETSHEYIVRLESRVHELEQQIEALQAPKICATCRYNNECYTYRDIATEQNTYLLSCAYYKPKDKE